jgi:tRNA G18 (ribose-2'-O)-methylase SpoU
MISQTGCVLQIVAVAAAGDPRLADYTQLTDMKLRKSLEAEYGLFVAEGEKVIGRAVAAGYPVRSVLVPEGRVGDLDWLDGILGAGGAAGEDSQAPDALNPEVPVYVVPDEVAEGLTGYHVHRGALASMRRLPLPAVKEVLAPARRIIVLEDIVDHANVGAIFRCAAALGAGAVILSPRCADPLYRRAVKVSMGAVFAIPYARMTDWHGGLAELKAAGFTLLALTPDQAAEPIQPMPADSKAALMLGCEGDGLSSRWLHEADKSVCIPMDITAMGRGVDSLNVVAAAAIACHLLTQ